MYCMFLFVFRCVVTSIVWPLVWFCPLGTVCFGLFFGVWLRKLYGTAFALVLSPLLDQPYTAWLPECQWVCGLSIIVSVGVWFVSHSVTGCVVCQSQCHSVMMYRTLCLHVFVLRITECLKGCIVKLVEPVLFQELCHTRTLYYYHLL